MKILFLIENYNKNGGATRAFFNLRDEMISYHKIYCFCKNIKDDEAKNAPKELIVGSAADVLEIINKEDIEILHFFKSNGHIFFREIVNILKKNKIKIPIINTICQRPSCFSLLLTLFEIINSNILIFIDISSYNNKIYNFIPLEKKRMIYFVENMENKIKIINKIKSERKKENDGNVCFGYCGSISKINKRIINIFDKIKIKNKILYIIGDNNSTFKNKYINKENIIILPSLEYTEYLRMINTFDIFFYILKKNAYSSIDGTLGDAMLLGKASIVYGPDAPKERIHHGENGFIASSENEIIKYSELLSKNRLIREKIEKNANISVLKNFSREKMVSKYLSAYNDLHKINIHKISVPFSFLIINISNYFYKKITNILPNNIRKIIIKKINLYKLW